MNLARAIGFGMLAFFALLAAYFIILTLVSGGAFALSQFRQFWYYVLPLAAGFGIQIGRFTYLKRLVSAPHGSRTVVAASGTGSEVMQRIAAPMLGGMITAPLLSMFLLPAAYYLLRRRKVG